MATGLTSLATVLYDKGDYAGAEGLYREALAIQRKFRGNEHPDVARSLNNLAGVLREQGDYAGAEALHGEAVALARKLYGKEHPRLAISLVSRADTLCRERKPAEGEPPAREALEIFGKSLPAGHSHIAETESVLGGCLTLSGRYGEAEPLLLRSYPVLKARTGQQSLQTRNALQRLVALYLAWDKPNEAATYREELATIDPHRKQ